MTKDELLNSSDEATYFNADVKVIPLGYINDFFNSNVCIPKGENRHPCADVLHEWIEGANNIEFTKLDGSYIKLDAVTDYFCTGFRIKPSEPTYEWQWYTVYSGLTHLDNNFYTEQELIDFSHSTEWKKIEETKRVRNV